MSGGSDSITGFEPYHCLTGIWKINFQASAMLFQWLMLRADVWCHTRGRPITSTPLPSVKKAEPTLGFETQRRRQQKSKTGASVAPQKGLLFSKNFTKNNKTIVVQPTDSPQ